MNFKQKILITLWKTISSGISLEINITLDVNVNNMMHSNPKCTMVLETVHVRKFNFYTEFWRSWRRILIWSVSLGNA